MGDHVAAPAVGGSAPNVIDMKFISLCVGWRPTWMIPAKAGVFKLTRRHRTSCVIDVKIKDISSSSVGSTRGRERHETERRSDRIRAVHWTELVVAMRFYLPQQGFKRRA